jgi:ADP-heptose:LPS heptosyltransferase
LIELLRGVRIVQIGVEGEQPLVDDFRASLSLEAIRGLLGECDTWISIDSFLPHLAYGMKRPGVVIFSQSDPKIFGYKQNVNLLKSRSFLRRNQFEIWEQAVFNAEAFVSPSVVFEAVMKLLLR